MKYQAQISYGLPLEKGHTDADVCTRVVEVKILASAKTTRSKIHLSGNDLAELLSAIAARLEA